MVLWVMFVVTGSLDKSVGKMDPPVFPSESWYKSEDTVSVNCCLPVHLSTSQLLPETEESLISRSSCLMSDGELEKLRVLFLLCAGTGVRVRGCSMLKRISWIHKTTPRLVLLGLRNEFEPYTASAAWVGAPTATRLLFLVGFY